MHIPLVLDCPLPHSLQSRPCYPTVPNPMSLDGYDLQQSMSVNLYTHCCIRWYTWEVVYNNNRRLVTLAEHTSDHGKQTNSSTKEKGEHG